MGFAISDPFAMGLLGSLESEVMTALANCISRVEGAGARPALTRWFGSTATATIKDVKAKLTRMRSLLNTRSIPVAYTSVKWETLSDGKRILTRGGSNAAAMPSTGVLGLGATLPSYSGSGFAQSSMWIDTGFNKLPKYLPLAGGRIDSSGWNQSKLNTIVHELSHLILGTTDVVVMGQTMYGAQRAERLASLQLDAPSSPLDNAENWGIFVEALGRNNAS